MRAAAYLGTRALYADMVTAAKSLLLHTDVDKVYFLIEDDVFPCELCDRIETVNAAGTVKKYFRENGINADTEWTYFGLVSGAFTKVFPDLDRLLTIDCDTIVTQDISELFELEMDDCYVAGVPETLMSAVKHRAYINAGVMMLNLAKLRRDGKDDEIIRNLNRYRYAYVTQDAVNDACRGGILCLPSTYNACAYTETAENPKIIHYAGIRGRWRDYPLVRQYRDMPWERVEMQQDICGKPLHIPSEKT